MTETARDSDRDRERQRDRDRQRQRGTVAKTETERDRERTLNSRSHHQPPPPSISDSTLKPTDPRWIGAWWMGFLLVGALAIVSSLPMLFFPRRLPLFRAGQSQLARAARSMCTHFLLQGVPCCCPYPSQLINSLPLLPVSSCV